MVRTVLKGGVFVPVDPLPAEWRDGAAFRVEADDEEPADFDPEAWLREMNELCATVSPAEDARFRASLAEVERVSKEQARREMGLS